MRQISESANLSKVYTNHKIRGTTASVMKDKFGLIGAAHVSHHHLYELLRSYLAKPTLQEKAKYGTALFNFTKKEGKAIAPDRDEEMEEAAQLQQRHKLSCKKKTCAVSKPP